MQALLKASENGKYPIVMDTSPCLAQVKASLSDPALRCARVLVSDLHRACSAGRCEACNISRCCPLGLRFSLYEPVEFIRHFLVDKLEFTKVGFVFGLCCVCVCFVALFVVCFVVV